MASNPIATRYRQHDYAVINGFFPDAVISPYRQFIQQALDADVNATFQRWGLSIADRDCSRKVRSLLEGTHHLPVADQHVLLGQFPLSARLSDAIMPLAEFIGKSRVMQALLESERLYLHMPPMIRFVPPCYETAAVPPHQDISYNRHMSEFITLWAPMVPITDRCGGLIIYEGSQALPDTITDEKRPDSWLPPIDVSGFAPKRLTGLGTGDVVVLSSRIVHQSAPNTSERIRLSMDLRVFGERGTSSKHCIDLQHMQIIPAKAA